MWVTSRIFFNLHFQIKLTDCRRVVLFSLDNETHEVEMRHYLINASPVGLTRSVKKIVKAKIPDLNRFQDISDYVLGYRLFEYHVLAADIDQPGEFIVCSRISYYPAPKRTHRILKSKTPPRRASPCHRISLVGVTASLKRGRVPP